MFFPNHILICLVMAAALSSGPSEERAGGRQIFRRALQGDTQLVVIQEPMVSADAIKEFLPPGLINRPVHPPIGYFTMSIELRSGSSPPLAIWSQVGGVYYAGQLDEYQVLDVLKLPAGRIALAMVGPGSSIVILDVSVTEAARQTSLASVDWSLLAAATPNKPGRLSAKFTYNPTVKRISVEVTDFLQDTKQHTLFEQKDEQWDFVRVKQWQEKVPATNPAAR
jgi:hypothetical protein